MAPVEFPTVLKFVPSEGGNPPALIMSYLPGVSYNTPTELSSAQGSSFAATAGDLAVWLAGAIPLEMHKERIARPSIEDGASGLLFRPMIRPNVTVRGSNGGGLWPFVGFREPDAFPTLTRLMALGAVLLERCYGPTGNSLFRIPYTAMCGRQMSAMRVNQCRASSTICSK